MPLAVGDRGDGPEEAEEETLNAKEHSLYRTIVGSLLCLAQDRHDVSFAVRICAKQLSRPTATSMVRLRRLVRFLWVTRGDALYIENGGGIRDLVANADADWAGDRRDRKSNSCAAIVVAGVMQLFVARGQATTALSSAESET